MYLKYIFYIKNGIFLNCYIKHGNIGNFLKAKSDPNMHPNSPNCTI